MIKQSLNRRERQVRSRLLGNRAAGGGTTSIRKHCPTRVGFRGDFSYSSGRYSTLQNQSSPRDRLLGERHQETRRARAHPCASGIHGSNSELPSLFLIANHHETPRLKAVAAGRFEDGLQNLLQLLAWHRL